MANLTVSWRVDLYDSLVVSNADTRITHFRTNRSAVLLAYLANQPGTVYTRDSLGELLWPNDDPDKQRERLRHELSLLRKQLGKTIFETSGRTKIALGHAHTSDTAEFDRALRKAAHSQDTERIAALEVALELYKGDFLSDYWDDEWINAERERRRNLLRDSVALPLIALLEAQGRDEESRWVQQRVHQLLPDFQPLRRSNISRPATSSSLFLGRVSESSRIAAWLESPLKPLLTLVGLGGIGKTTLARHCLPEALFVSLAAANSTGDFWSALREQLTTTLSPEPRLDVLDALAQKPPQVLILDNLEQFAPTAARCIQDLLKAAPGTRVLATSRRALKLPQEQTIALPPLAEDDGLRLLLQHARSVSPSFGYDSPEVAREIVRMLEGIPLAIELAAVRALVVDAETMRDELESRLRFLVSLRRQRDERQLSLSASLLWSYDCLSDEAKITFSQLSVFQGASSLAAIRAVCTDQPPVLNALEELVLHHLVTTVRPYGELRYNMLALVREFAAECLTPQARARTGERHAAYYHRRSQQIGGLAGAQSWREATALLREDRAELPTMIAYFVERRDVRALTELVQYLPLVLSELGAWECLDALLTAAETQLSVEQEPAVVTRILAIQAALFRRRGRDQQAAEAWSRRYEIAEKVGLSDEAASSLQELFMQALEEERLDEARALLTKWRPLATGDSAPVVAGLLEARLYAAAGTIGLALEAADRVQSLLEGRKQLPRNQIFTTTYLAGIYRQGERWDTVDALASEGVALCLQEGFLYPLAVLILEQAAAWEHRGRLQDAAGALLIAQKIHATLRSRHASTTTQALAAFRERHRDVPGLAPWLQQAEALPWQALPQHLNWPIANLVHDLSTMGR